MDTMLQETSHPESKFLLKILENISPKPIQSIGTYVSLDAEYVVAGSSDKNLRFLDTDTLDEIARCAVNKKSVNCVAISEMSLDGEDPIIVTGGKDSFIQIWNPTSGSLERNIEVPANEVRSLAIYQGSETYILVGTKDSQVILWDAKRNCCVRVFEGHRASVHSVSISSSVVDIETENDLDFLCIASGGADRTVRTWDLNTGRKKKKFRHSRSISTMVVANKGIRPILATAGVERIIKLWDVESGVLLRSLEGHLDQINTLSLWEGYQMLLISGSSDRTLRIYDILSGECVCVLVGHTDAVLSATIANYDDPKIVSCSDDLSLIQWDLKAVLEEFFYSSDEQMGARNLTPAYLPSLEYVAPQELDKTQLTKEQRKLIRKEQKKEKRLRSSAKYSSSGKLGNGEFGEGVSQRGSLLMQHKKHMHDYDEEEEEDAEEEEDDAEDDDVGFGSASVSPVKKSSKSKKVVPAESVGVRKASVSLVRGLMQSFGINNAVGVEPILPDVVAAPVTMPAVADTDKPSYTVAVGAASSAEIAAIKAERKADVSNLRQLANEAHSKFSLAEVEKELEQQRQKSEAAAKLAMRLKLKKAPQSSAEGVDGSVSAPNGAGGNAEAEEAEMHRVKAEKLRQHKLQENRRNQSMVLAKDRAGQALQKRLDELAAKKKISGIATVAEGGSGNGDRSDDSDDDSA
jgi:WD40 repeat protein